jgi:hypothetical protein
MKAKRINGIEKYSNQWVALDSDGNKIIAGGKNLKKVLEQASKSVNKPVMMKVPPLDVSFSP